MDRIQVTIRCVTILFQLHTAMYPLLAVTIVPPFIPGPSDGHATSSETATVAVGGVADLIFVLSD